MLSEDSPEWYYGEDDIHMRDQLPSPPILIFFVQAGLSVGCHWNLPIAIRAKPKPDRNGCDYIFI